MKKRILAFLFITTLLLAQNSPAQNPPLIEWQKSLGGSNADYCRSLWQTSDSGFIAGGYTTSNDFDVSGNHGGSDCWIVKFDGSGTVDWQKVLGGSGDDVINSIEQTADGGYIVAANSSSTDGDVTGNHDTADFWIVKLNDVGDISWEESLGGSLPDFPNSIQQTTDGGYIIAGSSASTDFDVTGNHGANDVWIVKLNATGLMSWEQSYGGSGDDYANSIEQTTDGGFIVAGYSNSNDGDVTLNIGLKDYWVMKLDAAGVITWQKSYGGSSDDIANYVVQSTDGGYIVAGYSSSSDVDVSNNHGGDDCWIVKLGSAGNLEWEQSYGGTSDDQARAIVQLGDSSYVFAGYSKSNDGDVSGNHGSNDHWVVKISSTGIIDWQESLGGTKDDKARAIQETFDGGLIIAGHASSSNGDVTSNNGLSDMWVVRLESLATGIDESSTPTSSFVIYPNPATSLINIQFQAAENINSDATIIVCNLLGKTVLSQHAFFSHGELSRSIAIDDHFPAGIYSVMVKTDNKQWVQHAVVVK